MADGKVYIANYEHLGKVLWGAETISDLLDKEEDRLQKYPGVKYGWDNEAYTYDAMAREDPQVFGRMKDMVRRYAGRLAVAASTYGQPLSYFIGGESNVRQLTMAIRTDMEHFGVRPEVYIMSEHAHHTQIPQLIAQTGFKGALMRTHFCMYGLNPEIDASCVNWIGLDGETAVPTIPTYYGQQGYCAVNGYTFDRRTGESFPFGFNTIDNKILLDAPEHSPYLLDYFKALYISRIQNVIASRVDDPRQQEGIAALYAGDSAYPFILGMELMEAAGEPERDFVTGTDDFPVRMPWGFCGNWIWEKCRDSENRVYALETLDALLTAAGRPGHKELLTDLWKQILINQHHDIQICGLEEEARRHFGHSDRLLGELEREFSAGEGTAMFNSLPWERTDPASGMKAQGLGIGVKTEAAGVCSIHMERELLETTYYTVRLSEDGGFDGVTDKRTGRELFDDAGRSGFLCGSINGVYREQFGVWNALETEFGCMAVDAGYIGDIPYETEWRFYSGSPRIDCQVRFEPNLERIGRSSEDTGDTFSAFIHDEKLRMKFFPNLTERAQAWHDQPFGAGRTERSDISCGLWAALWEEGHGLGFFNRGIMDVTREADGGVSVPLAFSMYYVWSGVLKEPVYDGEGNARRISKHFLKGSFAAHLAVYPFEGELSVPALHRQALEYNIPLQPISEETAAALGTLALQIKVTDNVFVSSVYSEGGEFYVRFYEMGGGRGGASVTAGGKAVSLTPVDMLENVTGTAILEAELDPWQVKTFRAGL